MQFSNQYKVLNKSRFCIDKYSLVPIRMEDRFDIMKWRNEQIYLLRQNELLTEEDQNTYFANVVSKLFMQEYPTQILLSLLENDKLIGYGGLVHIDWHNLNAEISFLLNPELNSDQILYTKIFGAFLNMIEGVANCVKLHKIYTYGYDLVDFRFKPLIANNFNLEANLVRHVKIDNVFYNVKIYSKLV
ncbi:MAG: hypothetical protein BWY38_03211 [Ignavibacteria bacterium ADurb.Bin266]|nr:MAG: hypothetical protein BWY38_03211 [Ignavibacteria bacterium ADurb.Bin266]